MRDKKLSRGMALVFVVLIMGLLAGSVSAATIEEEIDVGPRNPHIFEFTVEKTGTIYAEAKLEKNVEKPRLILESLSMGEIIKTVGGDPGELLTLSYDVSERDLDVGTRWKISVESDEGEGIGYIKITYPSDTTPPTVIENTPTGENVPVATEITITFSEQMDAESVIGAFSIHPEVDGKFDWDDNTMIFMPSSNFNYGTRCVVELEGAMDLAGNNMEFYNWDFETVSPELIPPTAYIGIYPNPAREGERVTFEGYGEDEDGEVVECRWTFPDGTTRTVSGSSDYFEDEDVQAGWYSFAVRDEDGAWSEDVGLELMITGSLNTPPTAYIDIYPNPAGEGERVTFEGYGEDEDGEVVECRWTFPDGRTRSVPGSYDYFENDGVQAGWYSFAIRDDEGAWSEEVGVELELETSLTIPWTWILAATVLVIAAIPIIRRAIKRSEGEKERNKNGLIYADSNPQNALIFLDEVYRVLSPATVHEVSVGTHVVKFKKFGYFDCKREAMVNANQTTHVHCDLTEIPEIKLKLSAEPVEIPADGKSKSTITIRMEDKNGIPIPVPEDVTIELGTNIGTIESPVKILAGRASVTVTLTSSEVKGTATVKAKAEFLKGSTTVEFLQST